MTQIQLDLIKVEDSDILNSLIREKVNAYKAIEAFGHKPELWKRFRVADRNARKHGWIITIKGDVQ